MNYRIEKMDAFTVVARKKRFTGSKEITHEKISRAWEECGRDGTIGALCRYVNPGNVFGNAILGICFDNPDKGDFDYAIGAMYEGGELADGLSLEEVPANTWAVFSGTGSMPDAFLELWKVMYTEFFPTSNYQPSGGMCIEVYKSDEVQSENFEFEIWLSVEAK